MKRIILWSAAMLFTLTTLAQADYQQWEVMNIIPKIDKLDLFKKGLAAHNKKYHASGPYKVGVSSVITGPSSGAYSWIMGPCTWTELDARPVKGEHDLDWDKNVTPYCESIGEVSYWRLDKDVNYNAPNSATFLKSRLRFHTVYQGKQERVSELFKKIAEVYKKKAYPASYHAYWRMGASAGPHVAVSIDFAKWAHFDNASTIAKDFDEVHGANSWNRFMEDLALCIDLSKSFDELNEYDPSLSGGN